MRCCKMFMYNYKQCVLEIMKYSFVLWWTMFSKSQCWLWKLKRPSCNSRKLICQSSISLVKLFLHPARYLTWLFITTRRLRIQERSWKNEYEKGRERMLLPSNNRMFLSKLNVTNNYKTLVRRERKRKILIYIYI